QASGMSAMGHPRRSGYVCDRSAHPPIANLAVVPIGFSLGPYADMAITPRVVPTRSDAGAEAVHRATIKFVAAKTADQLDLRALNQVRERVFNSSPCRQGSRGHQQIFRRPSYLRCRSVALRQVLR